MSGLSAPAPAGVAARAGRRGRQRPRVPLLVGAAFAVMAVVVLAAIFGPLLAPVDPQAQNLALPLARPSAAHLLGTDDLGRDVFSRTLAGARSALVGPLVVAIGAMLIGNTLGLIAGYFGGRRDYVIMRWVDFMYALPGLLIAIVVVGVLGGGYVVAVALLTLLFSPYDTRLIRAATLDERHRPYVEAARTLGLSDVRIMRAHIWPNLWPVVFANTLLTVGFALVALASLSFLGLGAGPESADWGRMLGDSRQLVFDNPWTAIAPAVMLVLTAASINVIGDWVHERLTGRTEPSRVV